jgi:hypothetical protein
MSNTGPGPWSLFADMVRQGVDSFVSTQKTLLDIAAQQNAMLMGAVQESFGRAVTPAMADLAGRSTQAFLQSQKMMLDLAVQQNQLALSMIKGSVGGEAGAAFRELADMLAEVAMTFVEAQKRLLEFAGQQAEAMIKAAREGGPSGPNPLSQMAELSRQGVQAFVDAQKTFLDLIAQGTASAIERVKQRQPEAQHSGEPAQDLAGMARRSLQNYTGLQRQLTEQAAGLMADWTRAWQSNSAWQPSATFEDLARQGVEAFVNAQRAILDLTFRTMSGSGTNMPGANRS